MPDPADTFDAALALHRAGDFAGAGRLYRQILEAHPGQPDALNLLASIEMEAGAFAAATALLRRAVEVAGAIPQFHCNLGNALVAQGEPAGAVDAYREAVRLDPGYLDAHIGLGYALARSGAPRDAVASCEAALAIEPDNYFALSNLGEALIDLGLLDEAVEALRRAAAAAPAAPAAAEAYARLAAALRAGGRLPEATESLWAAVETGDAGAEVYRALGSLLRVSRPAGYHPDLERRMLGWLQAPAVDHLDGVEFATGLVRHKFAGARQDLDGEALLADPLASALLTRAVNGDAAIERALTATRRRFLLTPAGASEPALEPLSVLALQCLLNEHVFAAGPDETAAVDALRRLLETGIRWGDGPDEDAQRALLRFAAYAPPAALTTAAAIAAVPESAWAAPLRPVIARGIREPLEEAAIMPGIPSAGSIDDPVSRAVKAQYEESPYPRWRLPAYRDPANLRDILQSMFPWFPVPERLAGPVRVLVAGGGTGHHPISIAMRYANAEVVATDISRASLAYGVRMAGVLDVTNVRFVENDLLSLSAMEGAFDAIECVGVLHHTDSVERGIAALLGKLREDGVMKIGLYSQQAREPVLAARARIADLGLAPTPGDIRRFRSLVLEAPAGDPLRRVLEYGDFYALSSCRDLLFNVQEQNLTIPRLGEILAALGLEFVGFESTDDELAELYRRRVPGAVAMNDLDHWAAIEAEHPGLFAGMYQFWCVRGGTA